MTKILSGFTQVAYCMEKSFSELFALLQTKIRLHGDDNFLTALKKTRYLLCM